MRIGWQKTKSMDAFTPMLIQKNCWLQYTTCIKLPQELHLSRFNKIAGVQPVEVRAACQP